MYIPLTNVYWLYYMYDHVCVGDDLCLYIYIYMQPWWLRWFTIEASKWHMLFPTMVKVLVTRCYPQRQLPSHVLTSVLFTCDQVADRSKVSGAKLDAKAKAAVWVVTSRNKHNWAYHDLSKLFMTSRKLPSRSHDHLKCWETTEATWAPCSEDMRLGGSSG